MLLFAALGQQIQQEAKQEINSSQLSIQNSEASSVWDGLVLS
jgi:hypothetical protein